MIEFRVILHGQNVAHLRITLSRVEVLRHSSRYVLLHDSLEVTAKYDILRHATNFFSLHYRSHVSFIDSVHRKVGLAEVLCKVVMVFLSLEILQSHGPFDNVMLC